MSALSLNSSHIGSLPPPSQQVWPRKSSDQRSHNSNQSNATIQHNPDRKTSAGSTASLSSRTTIPLRVVNQNIITSRNSSYHSLNRLESGGSLRPKLYLEIPQDHVPWESKDHHSQRPGADSSLLANDGTLQGNKFKAAQDTPVQANDQEEEPRVSSDAERSKEKAIDHLPCADP